MLYWCFDLLMERREAQIVRTLCIHASLQFSLQSFEKSSNNPRVGSKFFHLWSSLDKLFQNYSDAFVGSSNWQSSEGGHLFCLKYESRFSLKLRYYLSQIYTEERHKSYGKRIARITSVRITICMNNGLHKQRVVRTTSSTNNEM